MLCGSVSILSSASSFPANSKIQTSSSSTTSVAYFNSSKPNPRFYTKSLPFKFRASLNQSFVQNDSTSPENIPVTDFVRFKRGNGDIYGELQTSIVTYRPMFSSSSSSLESSLQVDLVPNVHLADKEYFAVLQKELDSYDRVLYEMLGGSMESSEIRSNMSDTNIIEIPSPEGSSILERGLHNLEGIKGLMARPLTFATQLDCLDYQRQHWVHADLDYETFKLLQVEKGGSLSSFPLLGFALAKVQAVFTRQDSSWRSKLLWTVSLFPKPLIIELLLAGIEFAATENLDHYSELKAFARLDLGAKAKVLFAKGSIAESCPGTAEVDEKSVIIGERNRVVTEVLRRSISEGHKRIAVLYGGGHMPDMERRLRKEFNLVRTEVRWLTAWSVRNRNQEIESTSLPFLKTLGKVTRWPLDRYHTLAMIVLSLILALDVVIWKKLYLLGGKLLVSIFKWISLAASTISQFMENAS